ncbi:MAG: YtxH domain-containing protein [Thermoanaerobaculia bacterium]
MFTKKENRFGLYALTFGLGAITGAAVALLFAPYPGKKMQKKVSNATDRVLEAVEEQVENVQSVVRKISKA